MMETASLSAMVGNYSVGAAWLAIIATVISAGALIVLHPLSPEFEPSWRMVSEYANGQHRGLLTVVFLAWALSSIALTVALVPFATGWIGTIGLLILILAGVGEAMGGLFDVNHRLHGAAFGLGVPVAARCGHRADPRDATRGARNTGLVCGASDPIGCGHGCCYGDVLFVVEGCGHHPIRRKPTVTGIAAWCHRLEWLRQPAGFRRLLPLGHPGRSRGAATVYIVMTERSRRRFRPSVEMPLADMPSPVPTVTAPGKSGNETP